MLLPTDIPTDEERAAVQAALPWSDKAFGLAGIVRASLDNQAVDLLEGALGPPHARAALVALYEGCDVLLQAGIDLADAMMARRVLGRIDPRDPLGGDDARMNAQSKERLRLRAARFKIEDAAHSERDGGAKRCAQKALRRGESCLSLKELLVALNAEDGAGCSVCRPVRLHRAD